MSVSGVPQMTDAASAARSVTRGYGLLEGFLASQRARMADSLIPLRLRHGTILDIGCGCEPYFLTRTDFANKIGVDKVFCAGPTAGSARHGSIGLMPFDINANDQLPFRSESFNVITMLAVFEHLSRRRLVLLINEIERVLKSGGVYILTTPAGWTAPILTTMKWLRLVSPVEIDEHQDAYSRAKLRAVLRQTRFAGHPMRFGSFELFMNNWVVVTKESKSPVACRPHTDRQRTVRCRRSDHFGPLSRLLTPRDKSNR